METPSEKCMAILLLDKFFKEIETNLNRDDIYEPFAQDFDEYIAEAVYDTGWTNYNTKLSDKKRKRVVEHIMKEWSSWRNRKQGYMNNTVGLKGWNVGVDKK